MWKRVDTETEVLCIEVEPSKIVLLQALFESYDGIGIVKTLDHLKGLVCIIAASAMRPECEALLSSAGDMIAWREFENQEDLETLFDYTNVG